VTAGHHSSADSSANNHGSQAVNVEFLEYATSAQPLALYSEALQSVRHQQYPSTLSAERQRLVQIELRTTCLRAGS